MLKKHNKHGPLKWFAGVLAAASLLTALPSASPVYAAGDTGSSTAVQTAYTGFSAVSDVKVNNVSVKRYGHYSLSFNGNGNTGGSMQDYSDIELDKKISLKNGYTKKGYHFIDWDTKADGTGVNYEALDSATADTVGATDGSSVTLYAQWKPNTFKVVFHANSKDAKGEMAAQTMTYDKTAVLHNVTYTRQGYELAGWSTSAGSTDIAYKNMAVVRNLASEQDAEINLYAVWHGPVANAAKISIDPLSHQHTFVWKSDYEGHWQECTVCGYKTAKESHAAYDEKRVVGDLSKCGYNNYIYNHCTKCGKTWRSHEGQKKHNPFVTKGAAYQWDNMSHKEGDWAYAYNDQRHDLYCVDCGDEIDSEAWTEDGKLSEDYLHDERYDVPGLRERIKETGPLPRYHVHDGKIIGGPYGSGTCDICGAAIPDTIWGEYWWYTDDLDIYPNGSGLNGTDAWGKTQVFDVYNLKHTFKRNADGTITATFWMPYLPDITSMTMGAIGWNYGRSYPLVSSDGLLDWAARRITFTFVYKPSDNYSATCIRNLALKTSDGKTYNMTMHFQLRGDITAPTVNADVISASQNDGWKNNITLNLEGTEDVTNFVNIWVRTSDSKKTWLIKGHQEAVSNNKWSYSTSLDVSADATGKDLIITVVDANYNETTITKHITNIDTKAPEITSKVDYSGDANWTKERTITVHATDGGGSGNVKDGSIEIALNNHGDYQKGTNTGKDFTRTYVFAGDKYNDDPYVIFLRDPAGNESQTGINIGRIDNSIPTIQSAPVNGRSVTVTASDYVDGYGEGSGVTTYGYIDVSSKDTSVHKQTSNVITLPHDGEFLIVVYDKVGNMSEPFTVRVGNVSSGAKKVTFFDTGEMN